VYRIKKSKKIKKTKKTDEEKKYGSAVLFYFI